MPLSKTPIFLLTLFTALLFQSLQSQQSPTLCAEGHPSEEELLGLSLQCFQQKYKYQTHDGNKLARIIDAKVNAYKKILQHILMDKVEAVKTAPVIKWAQNKQKIFVNFKLSHRQGTPPCSDVRFDKFNVTNVQIATGQFDIQNFVRLDLQNNSGFSFEGFCFFTNQKFLFQLDLTFHGTITNLTIEKEGLGSYTIVGDKKISQIWIDPFPGLPKPPAIWTQLRYRYQSDMDQYFEIREKRKEEEEKKKNRKHKKRPTASTPTPSSNNADSKRNQNQNNQEL